MALIFAASLATLASLVVCSEPEELALISLFTAERLFLTVGMKQVLGAAFLANFANDGMAFEPAPVRLVETWSARPANPNPKALKHEWEPAQAGVGKSLDMGYTTGPFKLTDTTRDGPPKHGV